MTHRDKGHIIQGSMDVAGLFRDKSKFLSQLSNAHSYLEMQSLRSEYTKEDVERMTSVSVHVLEKRKQIVKSMV